MCLDSNIHWLIQTIKRLDQALRQTLWRRSGTRRSSSLTTGVSEDDIAKCQCLLNGPTVQTEAKTSTTGGFCLITLKFHSQKTISVPTEMNPQPSSVAADIACNRHEIARCSSSSAAGAEARTSPLVGRESDDAIEHCEAKQCRAGQSK